MRALLLLLMLQLAPAIAAEPVLFDWFAYHGDDAAFAQPVPSGSYRNPVLAGFHPDPSVVAVDGRYYLVNSSFAFDPGIPVYYSDNLVHWSQIGNVIERPTQIDFDGLGVSRGIFAATISHHDGVFHVAGTAVDSGGTFISTARDPAGPWSDPVWLEGIGGIDPSLFFDDDGKAYLLNNDAPPGMPRYEGHRAIWMQRIDLATLAPIGPRKVVLDGGVDPAANPIWIEGPHLYKHDGWYYLSAAEGGTGPQHAQVVLRSRLPWGPYLANPDNPILTQRDLPAQRPLPVANAGHADFVQAADGRWWALLLASRTYGAGHYNTGRETWLLPMQWVDGWPRILAHGEAIPYVVSAPSLVRERISQPPNSGNFDWRDGFDDPSLDREWVYLRVPKRDWADLSSHPGQLAIHPLREGLDTLRNPSFLARRQQHLVFKASTALQVPEAGVAAGIVAFQNEQHWYFLGVRRNKGGAELFLEKRGGNGPTEVLATRTIEVPRVLTLMIDGDHGHYAFGFDADGLGWQWLVRHDDATILSTDVAGGFVGTMLGPYARDEGR